MIRTSRKPLLFLCYIIAAAVLIWFDQFTKALAIKHLKDQAAIPLIKGVFQLNYLENQGMAWGLFSGKRTMFLISTTIILLAIVYFFLRSPAVKKFILFRLSLCGLFAGAIGNMIDRYLNGYVVDFFDFNLINFPIFNVADCYVVVCGILFAVIYLFYYTEDELGSLLPKRKH